MNAVIDKIKNLPQSLIIIFAFILATCLYWPSLNGDPVWDDSHFLFNFEAITGHFSYIKIWQNYVWPLSISAEKILFLLFKKNYVFYHVLNLLIHFLNSYFLLKLVTRLKLPYPKYVFMIFLLHPANVISVSWMIQLKTLLCFTFAILSFSTFIKAMENKKWFTLSWLFFLLSILSKAASIPLGLLPALYVFNKRDKKSILWIMPFILISAWSSYRILKSPLTRLATQKTESKEIKVIPMVTRPSVTTTPKADSPIYPTEPKEEISFNLLKIISSTLHYYFWQIILPLEAYPIQEQTPRLNPVIAVIHLLLIATLISINWGTISSWTLIAGHIMLVPYLGIHPAPYMNITWVSDQHLYLAMPFFLCFLLNLLSKWKFQFAQILPSLFIVFFSYQTFKASHYYRDEIVFFKKSLEADKLNLAVNYNLILAYLRKGEIQEALLLSTEITNTAENNSVIKKIKYYEYIENVHEEMLKLHRN